MAVRPVRLYGDPVLRQKALPVFEVDDTVRELIADMRETMRAYNGVGLAANQVGVLHRVLVVDVPVDEASRARYAFVNPVLDQRAGAESGEEGCLSIPGLYEEVRRAQRVRVRGLDEHGRPVEFVAEGYLARALQHEVDHLDGVLFVDRLSLLKRQFLREQLQAIARGELPGDARPPASRSLS
ncbi:MAG: peptide deformylase [Candidatus Eiseniibacteriota bacterium]